MLRIKFNKSPQNFREKNPGSFCVKPDKILQESGKASGKKIQEDLIQSQVRFNRVLEKVPGKGSGKDYGSVWC